MSRETKDLNKNVLHFSSGIARWSRLQPASGLSTFFQWDCPLKQASACFWTFYIFPVGLPGGAGFSLLQPACSLSGALALVQCGMAGGRLKPNGRSCAARHPCSQPRRNRVLFHVGHSGLLGVTVHAVSFHMRNKIRSRWQGIAPASAGLNAKPPRLNRERFPARKQPEAVSERARTESSFGTERQRLPSQCCR